MPSKVHYHYPAVHLYFSLIRRRAGAPKGTMSCRKSVCLSVRPSVRPSFRLLRAFWGTLRPFIPFQGLARLPETLLRPSEAYQSHLGPSCGHLRLNELLWRRPKLYKALLGPSEAHLFMNRTRTRSWGLQNLGPNGRDSWGWPDNCQNKPKTFKGFL